MGGDCPTWCSAGVCHSHGAQRRAHFAGDVAPAKMVPHGSPWLAEARGSMCHNVPEVRSLAGTIAPAK